MQAQFLYNPPGLGLYCHAPTLLELSNGDWLASWYAYPEVEHEAARLVLARKRAGQKEWGSSSLVLDAFKDSAGNPVLFQEPGGKVWLLFVFLKGPYWNDAELQGACSNDHGITWSQPIRLWSQRGLMVRHAPISCRDGSLLMPAYEETSRETVLLESRNAGNTWQEAWRFKNHALLQPVLLRDGPDRLSLFFRPWSDPRYIWRSHSSTEGKKWSEPLRTPLPCPLSGISAFRMGGRLGMIYNHTKEHQRHPLSLAWSEDEGVSWSAPRHLDLIQHELSYPSFLQSRDLRLHGLYTYNRRMIKYVCFEASEIA